MILTIGNNGNWFCEVPEDMWPDSEEFRKNLALDFDDKTGDKRQELVFIGQLTREEKKGISDALDSCLLSESEMSQYLNGDITGFEDPFEDWDDGQDEDGQDDSGEKPSLSH
jgi:hypothetical protein